MDNLMIDVPVWNQKVLSERNAVITGGTSGIGYSIADTFLSADCKNIIITSRNVERLERAILSLQEKHPEKKGHIFGAVLDLETIEQLQDAFDEICALLGDNQLDIWVINAGIYQGTRFGTVTEQDWDALLDINLKAQFFLLQLVSNYMIAHEICGNILNICSSSSFRPSIDPYMLSKLGMSGLTLGLAKKLIQHGIVVNGIAPGPTFTPMLHKKEGDSIRHGGIPAGRYILPQEVANLAVFLTSSMGRMIIGDVVKMTGGSAVITYDDVRY